MFYAHVSSQNILTFKSSVLSFVVIAGFFLFLSQSVLFQLALASFQGSCGHSKISILCSILESHYDAYMRAKKDISEEGATYFIVLCSRYGRFQWQAFLLQVGASQGSRGPQRGAVPHPEDDWASGKAWHCLPADWGCACWKADIWKRRLIKDFLCQGKVKMSGKQILTSES